MNLSFRFISTKRSTLPMPARPNSQKLVFKSRLVWSTKSLICKLITVFSLRICNTTATHLSILLKVPRSHITSFKKPKHSISNHRSVDDLLEIYRVCLLGCLKSPFCSLLLNDISVPFTSISQFELFFLVTFVWVKCKVRMCQWSPRKVDEKFS